MSESVGAIFVLAENVAAMIETMALSQWKRDIKGDLALRQWQSLAENIRRTAAEQKAMYEDKQ